MAFNIRVYGILINADNEVLLSDEKRFGKEFTKFPGGGLEQGEGLKDCIKREFDEELNIEIEVLELFYLTDFYQPSAFDENDQIISIYYRVTTNEWNKVLPSEFSSDLSETDELYRWRAISKLTPEDVTFPIDRIVAGMINEQFSN